MLAFARELPPVPMIPALMDGVVNFKILIGGEYGSTWTCFSANVRFDHSRITRLALVDTEATTPTFPRWAGLRPVSN